MTHRRPRYPVVFLDFDHTIFDSDESERHAFADAMDAAGVEANRHFADYQTINRRLWSAVERGEIDTDTVRVRRFEELLSSIGVDAAADKIAAVYSAGMASHGDLYPGAMEALRQLAGIARMALVTNAISVIQRTRIHRLGVAPLFEAIVISSEIGVAKPDPGIFDIAFDQMGSPDPSTVLMVGDSLSSDIAGGVRYGIATCWVSRNGSPPVDNRGPAAEPTHVIESITELPTLVVG